MQRSHLIRAALLGGAVALAGATAVADDAYPARPVKIVIGFAPGSGTDVTARLIAQELQKSLNQTFVVENRPGAAVQIAANLVKAAPPDGYTLLLTSNSSHSVNPHVYKVLSYDPVADFTPVGGVASLPFVVAVNADVPVKTLPELVTWSLEIGHYTTVPIATRTLAALGAEVIKIEPAEGEAVRRWPPMRNGQGIFFTFQNSDKKSACLDLETEDGRALLVRLIASADILVENLRPGALARKGFSPAEVERINPRLVYCSISGFGADSLYPGRAAFDTVIQAMSGLMDVTGVNGMPLKTGPSSADVLGAACGFTAMVAALEYRDASGHGQYIDLSMQDITAWATQTLWNGVQRAPRPAVIASGDGHVLGQGGDAVPVLGVGEVLQAGQTMARRLWFTAQMEGAWFPLLAVPFRLDGVSPLVLEPAPPLGRDTEEIARGLPEPGAAQTQERFT